MSSEESFRKEKIRRLRTVITKSYNLRAGMTKTEWLTPGIVMKAYPKGSSDGFTSDDEARKYLEEMYNEGLLEKHPT